MLLCGLVAVVIGLPVLRLTDVYLAICTLGFGEVVRILIVLLPGLTGGPTGANLSTGFPYEAMRRTDSWMIALFLALLVYLFWTMSRSRTGRAFRAMRERALAASTMGIDLVAYRSLAFLMSAMIAGAAGAFYAHSVGSLDNGDFRFTRAVDILGYAVVGGSGAWFGPLLGAGLLTALPILLRDVLGASVGFLRNFAQLPNILTGAALVLVIVFLPGGLTQVFQAPGHQAAGTRGLLGDGRTHGNTVTMAWRAAPWQRRPGRAVSRGARPDTRVRRRGGAGRREPAIRRGTHLRADRSQRRRQDHVHQPRLGDRRPELRHASPGRAGRSRAAGRTRSPGRESPAPSRASGSSTR